MQPGGSQYFGQHQLAAAASTGVGDFSNQHQQHHYGLDSINHSQSQHNHQQYSINSLNYGSGLLGGGLGGSTGGGHNIADQHQRDYTGVFANGAGNCNSSCDGPNRYTYHNHQQPYGGYVHDDIDLHHRHHPHPPIMARQFIGDYKTGAHHCFYPTLDAVSAISSSIGHHPTITSSVTNSRAYASGTSALFNLQHSVDAVIGSHSTSKNAKNTRFEGVKLTSNNSAAMRNGSTSLAVNSKCVYYPWMKDSRLERRKRKATAVLNNQQQSNKRAINSTFSTTKGRRKKATMADEAASMAQSNLFAGSQQQPPPLHSLASISRQHLLSINSAPFDEQDGKQRPYSIR